MWITGEGVNGPSNFCVEREVTQLGLVLSEPSNFAEDSSEAYRLTADGRQLYEQYRDMPFDQGAGLFLNVIHEMRRRR